MSVLRLLLFLEIWDNILQVKYVKNLIRSIICFATTEEGPVHLGGLNRFLKMKIDKKCRNV